MKIGSGGGVVGSAQITDNSITNADINSAAVIARAKLASGLVLKVRKSAAQGLGGSAQLTFDTEVVDSLGAFAANVFTAPRAMNVCVVLVVPITNTESTVRGVGAAIRLNGSAIRGSHGTTGDSSGDNAGVTLVEFLTLALNDTIDATAYSNSTSQTAAGGVDGTCLTVYEV